MTSYARYRPASPRTAAPRRSSPVGARRVRRPVTTVRDEAQVSCGGSACKRGVLNAVGCIGRCCHDGYDVLAEIGWGAPGAGTPRDFAVLLLRRRQLGSVT